MKKILSASLTFTSSILGITAVYTSLLYTAAQFFLRGIFCLFVGAALVGLGKGGWLR